MRISGLVLTIVVLAAAVIAACGPNAQYVADGTPTSPRIWRTTEEQRVRKVVEQTYQSRTGRAAMIDDYALVEWLHAPSLGSTVGQAVVIRRRGVWRVVSAGGATYTALEVEHFGVPHNVAARLVADLARRRSAGKTDSAP